MTNNTLNKEADMTAQELKAFTDLLMVSDPWPLSKKAGTILENFATAEAIEHGYSDWIEAFHIIREAAAEEEADNGQFGVGA